MGREGWSESEWREREREVTVRSKSRESEGSARVGGVKGGSESGE